MPERRVEILEHGRMYGKKTDLPVHLRVRIPAEADKQGVEQFQLVVRGELPGVHGLLQGGGRAGGGGPGLSSMKPETKAEARRLLDAVEAERVRQGVLLTQMSGNTEYCPVAYQGAMKRGSAFLTTFIAFCKQLDIEIVLVNREGDAIT